METIENNDYPLMFFGAVNRRANPFSMKDEELWDSVNWWTEDRNGAKKVRPGLTAFLDQVDTNPVKGLFYAKFPNGERRLARLSGKKVYVVDPNSDVEWGVESLEISANFRRPEYTVLTAKVHIVDQISSSDYRYIEWTNTGGTDTVIEATYTSGADPVLPFKSKTVVQFHRRVYVANSYDSGNKYGSHIGWSSIDYENKGTDPASPWTTQSTVSDETFAFNRPIDQDYNGDINKLTNIADRINIYKENGIYRYNETSVFELFGLSAIDGSIATMPELKQDFFFTNEGFFRYDGTNVNTLGDGWYPIIKQMFHNGIDTTKIHSFAGNFLYFCYIGDVSYDGKTVLNACFVYNSFYDELSLWSFSFDITAIGFYVNSSKDKVIVMGDSGGRCYKLDYTANDDAGVKMKASMKTKYYFFNDPRKFDQITDMTAFATPGSEMQILGDKDFNYEPKELISVKGTETDRRVDYSKMGMFRNISFEIIWNGSGVRPEFWGLIPNITEASVRERAGA